MLTCIARSKQPSDESVDATPNKQAIKTLTSQIKDMALKASGAYRHCTPSCTSQPTQAQQLRNRSIGGESDLAASDRFRWSYRRTGSSNSSSAAGRRELEARLKGISSGEGTPASASGRRVDPIVFVEENEPKEWVAQVEPGVLITFVSLPRGGNDLKRIRFSTTFRPQHLSDSTTTSVASLSPISSSIVLVTNLSETTTFTVVESGGHGGRKDLSKFLTASIALLSACLSVASVSCSK
ncbi:Hypothetical predicted protein, partial [Olea europaea subsp. europaea]